MLVVAQACLRDGVDAGCLQFQLHAQLLPADAYSQSRQPSYEEVFALAPWKVVRFQWQQSPQAEHFRFPIHTLTSVCSALGVLTMLPVYGTVVGPTLGLLLLVTGVYELPCRAARSALHGLARPLTRGIQRDHVHIWHESYTLKAKSRRQRPSTRQGGHANWADIRRAPLPQLPGCMCGTFNLFPGFSSL